MEERIKELISILNKATIEYDKGTPIMTDKEWDDLYFELVQLEKETNYILPQSPTQHINYEVVNELKKVKHNHPMLSLDKTKDIETVKSFIKGHDWVIMAKMDGLTCSLHYLDGKLISAETRGNGIEGEDITHNALVIPSIPKTIKRKEDIIIDGEIICTYDNFESFKNEYKNPRNFASGSIRLLDSKECAKRNLTFVAWDMIKGGKYEFLSNNLATLRTYDFEVVPMFINGDGTDLTPVENYIDSIKKMSEQLSYPIDGVVFKYDTIKDYEAAGRTDHHFKGGLAYKFYDETYETEVKDIEWTMGRTGQLTPVLIYNDIEIDGAICNRASLHNITVMTQLMGGAYPGQKVYIYKANQIIPQVESAQEDNPNHVPGIQIPKICPYCGHPTEIRKDNDSEVLYCTNSLCSGKLINQLDHFCGKKGLDIKGLSKMTLEKLINWGWISSIRDIYDLECEREKWIKKPGFGTTSVDKILKAIENARLCTLSQYICALGIPLIGKVASKALEKEFKTYGYFRQAIEDKDERLYNIDGIGEVMIQNLINFDYTDADFVHDVYINEVVDVPSIDGNELEGKVFVITGKLINFKNRAELKAVIESHGGKVSDSISGKTDILINNDVNSTSSKNKAAQARNIPILSEADFIQQYIEK